MAEYLVISSPSSLMVLKTGAGEVVWSREGAADTVVCSEGAVFSSNAPRDSIQAFALSTGQQLWGGTIPWKPFHGLAYNPEEKQVVGNSGSLLYVVDPKSGRLAHSFEKVAIAPAEGIRGPTYLVDKGEFFIGGTVLDAKTGQTLHREDRFSALTSPTVTEDTIYISDSTERPGASGVVAMDRTNYTIKWKYEPQHKLPWLPLVTLSPVEILDGVGYVILSDATLRAINLETGQELGYWQPGVLDLLFWPVCAVTPVPGCVESTGVGITTSENMLFVSFGNGKLYAFER
jgi:outer membrane protein assembly factor BamB